MRILLVSIPSGTRRALAAGWAALVLVVLPAAAAETWAPDPDGYIRRWLVLAPIALPEGESGADAVLREQIPNEAALRPKAGDTVTVGGKERTWQPITAATNYVDFNGILNSANDHAAGYMVSYVECDAETPEVILAVASNDQGRIYFNGVDIYAFTEARPLLLDADKGRVTLKKGTNVFVFKVINEQNSWQGAFRLLDKSGRPLEKIRIRLAP